MPLPVLPSQQSNDLFSWLGGTGRPGHRLPPPPLFLSFFPTFLQPKERKLPVQKPSRTGSPRSRSCSFPELLPPPGVPGKTIVLVPCMGRNRREPENPPDHGALSAYSEVRGRVKEPARGRGEPARPRAIPRSSSRTFVPHPLRRDARLRGEKGGRGCCPAWICRLPARRTACRGVESLSVPTRCLSFEFAFLSLPLTRLRGLRRPLCLRSQHLLRQGAAPASAHLATGLPRAFKHPALPPRDGEQLFCSFPDYSQPTSNTICFF